jgi:hypothetical protein
MSAPTPRPAPQAAHPPVLPAPDPWWVGALESVAQPYFAFCKGAAKVMRRGRRA